MMFSKDRFRDFKLHTDTNEVSIGRKRFKLTPKEMGVLEMLNERSGTTVTRKELLDKVWGTRFANDQGLTQAISRIRGILSKSHHVSIRTIPKKGYQLRKRNVERKKSVINWMKTHSKLLTLMFIGLVIGFLLLTDHIKIRISKEVITKDQPAQTNSI